jgi:hypothetical protein
MMPGASMEWFAYLLAASLDWSLHLILRSHIVQAKNGTGD